ncbi:coniferyl-alcohol dehydrogenase [Nocardia shimofusensis]|uniref:coniferyl-alcohol dehydrogenase n=1 Tax=Nocardia shimofusensis TaxID=228596 RepID=UPI00082B3F71|nr:coniferyl-alcohol dehydrogenase [Nocardia shimofusensis]
METFEQRCRFDGQRVVVTGCASGIGASVVAELRRLGARVVGLDLRRPHRPDGPDEFLVMDQGDPASVDAAVARIGSPVDALFNVAGVSSGIGDPLRVVAVNFLGMRQFTEAIVAGMQAGASVVGVSSLAAAAYHENRWETRGLLDTGSFAEGVAWCQENPEIVADGGGYRLSKEALILYTARRSVGLAAAGIRINCTGPGVTDTPILDQLRTAYGSQYLDGIPQPLGRSADPGEQAAALLFLNSRAAAYITGQVLWVDGGNLAARLASELAGPAPATRQ